MTTKIKSGVIGDNVVGITQLNVSDGTNGQVLTTDGSGTLSFSTISGTTINNNADNRIITGSGTANTLEGESTLIYDGTILSLGSIGTSTATATPMEINMGSDFADTAGSSAKAKFKIYEDTNNNIYGLGVSSGTFEYHNSYSAGKHDWYIGTDRKMRITHDGIIDLKT